MSEESLPSTAQHVPFSSFAVIPHCARNLSSVFHERDFVSGAGDFVEVSVEKPFVVHHPAFLKLLGPKPSLRVLAEKRDGTPFAHEAPVWWEETGEVFVSSNLYGKAMSASIDWSAVNLETGEVRVTDADLSMPNGGIRFGDKIAVCSQGLGTKRPSSLAIYDPVTNEARDLLNNFFGRPFNSINDIAILPPPAWSNLSSSPEAYTTASRELHSRSTIWWTDPTYGPDQDFKPAPELPSQVYCFDPVTKNIRVVADGFDHPNGICFNLEGTKCYITDTGIIHGRLGIRPDRPSTIYVYDVVQPPEGSDLTLVGPTLANRAVFAYTDAIAPDGVKCDRDGNVYTGCWDGLHVFHPSGTLIGRISLFPDPASSFPDKSRTVANFCFTPKGGLVLCAEDRLYFAQIGEHVQGALL